MGFNIYRDWGGWVELSVGASLITLRKRGRSYDGILIGDGAKIQFAFRVAPNEIEACYKELVNLGVNILESVKRY